MKLPASARSGFTLIEVLVSLAILSIMLAVVAGTLVRLDREAPREAWAAELGEARVSAIRSGSSVVVWPDSASVHRPVLFLPDGRSIGAPALSALVDEP